MSSETEFSSVVERLDQIVSTVKSKDASLERSLDLLEEAIKLGMDAVERVDLADPTAQEIADSQVSAAIED